MTFSLLTSKVERVAPLKSSAAKLFDVFAYKASTIPIYAPDLIQSVDVHGDICTYNYTFEGKAEVFIAEMVLDEPNNTISFNAIGGDVTETYKEYKDSFKFTQKGNGSVFFLTVEVERRDLLQLPPSKFANFIVEMVEKVDDGISK